MISRKQLFTYHQVIVVISCLFFVLPLYGQQTISEVKAMPFGAVVTTTGTISCSNEFGIIRYMQDADAGIAVYDDDLSFTSTGDSVLITGVLSRYRGQVQISPVLSFEIIASGKSLESVLIENISDITNVTYESRRIILNCSGIASCEPQLQEGVYRMFDQFGNISRLHVSEDLEDEDVPVQTRPYTMEGIWTKFEDQYELLALAVADASEGNCHYIAPPTVSYDAGEVVLSWHDLPLAETQVLIGEDSADMAFDIGAWENTLHFTADKLESGKLYQSVLLQEGQGNIIYKSIPVWFAKPSSSKSIDILFNRSVNQNYSDGSAPLATGSSAILSDLVERIDQVQSTLEIAMYNTSNNSIVQAVNRAANRGVVVRYIADDQTSNSALEGVQSFPILYREGDGIMHNKFVVADAEDPDQVWLWAGSTNLSTNQLSTDPNHAYVIYDQAMALSYRREFDEMWGNLPNQSVGRSGDEKVDNTVHRFQHNEVLYESYFSPSDETACYILEALRTTDYHVEIGLLLLTYFELIDEIIELHQSGVAVRVIVDDEDSSDTALSRLRQAGVPVAVHYPNPIFHHKYAIIDEGYPDSDPQVVTGSHNWTWSADNINDENTLIIHDQSVANIFRQEFEARWEELVPVSVSSPSPDLISMRPNPASDFTVLNFSEPFSGTLSVMNLQGQIMVRQSIADVMETKVVLDNTLAPGLYLIHLNSVGTNAVARLIVQ